MAILYYLFINFLSFSTGVTLSVISFYLITKLETFLYAITSIPIIETLSTIPILLLTIGLYIIFAIVSPWAISSMINELAKGYRLGTTLTAATISILWIALTALAIIYTYPIGRIIIYILMVIATIVQLKQTIKGNY